MLSAVVSLRKVWESVKEYLKELFFIIINFLRRFTVEDYAKAFDMLMNRKYRSSRIELGLLILEFIKDKLKTEVYSSLTAPGIIMA